MMKRLLVLLTTLTMIGAASADEKPAPNPHAAEAKDKKPEDKKDKDEKGKDEKPKDDKEKKERKAETKHSITINGTKIDYTATAGLMPLKDAEGKVTAEIFFIAYTKDGVAEPTKRPITFSFNGGPGSSSVWMHLGLLGPKRVRLQDNGFAVRPPYELVDNESCILDETDLVFIDPVGTGYSHAAKPDEAKRFWGVKEDAASVAEFIRLYVTKNSRWISPKFLIGESYGTARAAALSGVLGKQHRMNLNGIMLVSTVLNFQTIWGGEGNELPFVLFLPTFTATAWHHKKLPADLQKLPLEEVLKQSEAFASGDYNQALLSGSALDETRRKALVKQYSRLTGLSESFVDLANLRVPMGRFAAELLRDQGLVLGRFDSRYTNFVRDRLSEGPESDPSADAVFSAFASTFNNYVRSDLKFEEDQPYHILAGVGAWNWGAENNFVNVGETLADSMTANPFLKVHISCGFFDLATPYFAARYTFHHLNVNPALAKNITMDDYSAGHMMYLNLPDLKKQKADLAKFIRAASSK